MITPVILSGGSGSRLWPLSRTMYPKQFLPLNSGQTMLQETVARLSELTTDAPMVICNEEHRFLAAEQLRTFGIDDASIVLEPVGRNTAPAIALAALSLEAAGKADTVMLVLAADHVIADVEAFTQAVVVAEAEAEKGKLVTFGIVPTEPATGYGYIKASAPGSVSPVAQFVEKPDLATAQGYVESGQYYWNSGMFMFTAKTYLAELESHRPDMLEACKLAMADTSLDLDFIRVNADAFAACPDDSVDYAVMEKTDQAVVVPMDAGWSDVGSWSALWDVKDKDAQGNVVQGDALLEATANTYVSSQNRLVATVGVDDLIIVDTQDAVLVAHKDKVQDVKSIVNRIKADGRSEANQHREVYRPWGKYDSIDFGDRYQVKRITVKPGAQLSLQKHHHRAEHWIVVSGTAEVRCGEQTLLLSENQSTYIPLGEVHQLKNPGKLPLELIEVQSGSYLGEDDIVRFEDVYGRA